MGKYELSNTTSVIYCVMIYEEIHRIEELVMFFFLFIFFFTFNSNLDNDGHTYILLITYNKWCENCQKTI